MLLKIVYMTLFYILLKNSNYFSGEKFPLWKVFGERDLNQCMYSTVQKLSILLQKFTIKA